MDAGIVAFAVGVIAYLLGSLSGSLLLGKLRHVDIRTLGSGNAGGTNAFRTMGWKFALGVVLIDVGKGALAAWLGSRVSIDMAWLCGALAVIGHVWPIFHGLRGGKGAATVVGVLLMLWPQALPWLLGTWVLVLIASGYVGLSTIIAGFSLPVVAFFCAVDSTRWAFAIFAALFLLFTHRGNLRKMRDGNENRFEKARLLHRWRTGR